MERWPDAFDWKLRRQIRGLILADAGDEYIGSGNQAMALLRYGNSLLEWPFNSHQWKTMVRICIKASLKCLKIRL